MVLYPGGKAINYASDVNAVGLLELLGVGLRPIRIGYSEFRVQCLRVVSNTEFLE